MYRFAKQSKRLLCLVPFLLAAFVAGCGGSGGGRDPILGTGGATVGPMVSSTTPANNATGVAVNSKIIATFNEAMNPATISATTFLVTGPGTTPVLGTVSYLGTNATFAPTVALAGNTAFTATIIGGANGAKDPSGAALASNYVWTFTTGAAPDTTPPTVTSTIPANNATGVALNSSIVATFSEAMDPLTITTATVKLTGPGTTPVVGAVTYVGTTATFAPTSPLANSTTYTATVIGGASGAKDLAGNPLGSNYVWTFATGAAANTTPPTITSTTPANLATAVAINASVNANFSEAMGQATISTASFTLTGPGTTPVAGTVSYAGTMATFTPTSSLLGSTTYTATIVGGNNGAKDLAGNALASGSTPNPWTFTTGATVAGPTGVNLRSLSTFVAVAGAGLTNSNSGGMTTLNGNVGLSPTATCLGDGSPCAATDPTINGTLYANDPGGIAAQAKTDLVAAYVDAQGRPPGTTVNDITGMVLAPGVYTSGSTMSIAVGGTVTLDANGDANAVWIFQIGSSLTVNNSAQVLLINGAKAGNVFWAAFASSTLGSNVSFKGNVLAGASNSVGTGSVVEGRLLCTTGQITLLSNTISLPTP